MQVLTDADVTSTKNMLPTQAALKLVEVDPATFSANVQRAVSEVANALSDIDQESLPFKIGEVSLTLAITASGEVSLMSVLKANTSMQAGIQIKFVPK